MIKTIVSVCVTLSILLGLCFYELWYIQTAFSQFSSVLRGLQDKAVTQTATRQDGETLQRFWEEKKHTLHIWVPHTAITEINYQLDEAVGFLVSQDYAGALSQLEVLLAISEDVPRSYGFYWENIF